MNFLPKFSSGDYFCVFASGKNNVVVLINPATESLDKPEYEIKDEDVVDTMGDYMLEATEQENGNIC